MKDKRGRVIEEGDTVAYIPARCSSNTPEIVLAEVLGFEGIFMKLRYRLDWYAPNEEGVRVNVGRTVESKTSHPERTIVIDPLLPKR